MTYFHIGRRGSGCNERDVRTVTWTPPLSARCRSPDEAPPLVSDSQSGVALRTLQENDGEQHGFRPRAGSSRRNEAAAPTSTSFHAALPPSGVQAVQSVSARHVSVPLRGLHRLPAEGQPQQHAGLHQEPQHVQCRGRLVSSRKFLIP